MRGPSALAVHNGLIYVADSCNHRVQIYNLEDGSHVRSIGRDIPVEWDSDEDLDYSEYLFAGSPNPEDPRASTKPGEFNGTTAIAIGHGRLYVSEDDGCRLQVLTLEGEPLHVIPSPDGKGMGGICVDGEHVWVIGEHTDPSNVHLFTLVS